MTEHWGKPLGFDNDNSWHARAVRTDARAATRGDILPPGASTRYPRYFQRASGSHIWDIDGNRYVDFNLGYGPVVLGHADARVNAAVITELENGSSIAPLWSKRQAELTALLTSVVPGAELAYALKTGSDANSAAVRLCRIFTGREKVVRWGYNGWHDWAAGIPTGIPDGVRSNTLTFDYGDLNSLREVFRRHPEQIACVLLMPFGDEVVPDAHLHAIRNIAHEHGALFVLDEMRSGFRLHLNGIQGLLDVQADVSTFSKAMANGHPISAVTGRADIMSCLAKTRISSTFYADPAPMAAALTTVAILRDTDAIEHLWTVGRAFQEGLAKIIARHGLPAEVVGYPPIPFLRFTYPDSSTSAALAVEFAAQAADRGVLLHPDHQWFVSAAHTMEDIELSLDACDHALAAAADAVAWQR